MLNALLMRTVVLLLALLMVACASQKQVSGQQVLDTHRQLLRGAAFFSVDEPLPLLEPVQLVAVNDDMRAFLDAAIPVKSVSANMKTERILRALLDDGLNLEYANLKTYTAEEIFYSREGNCLSFTNLFIALAREAGIIVSYQEVEVPPAWSAVGDTQYLSKHINVLVDMPRQQQKVVDFDVQNRSDKVLGTVVGDDVALAQYYNNMAVYYLGQDDLSLAFLNVRQAIYMQPATGYFWTNLGTILRRAGELDDAESAYLAAVDLSGEPAAISNLARLYAQQGKQQQAATYAQRAEEFRAQNPYYLFDQAELAFGKANFKEANRLLSSAIKKRRDEPEFYRLLGLTWVQLGRPHEAEASFKLAVKHSTDPHRTSLYEHKLHMLAHTD